MIFKELSTIFGVIAFIALAAKMLIHLYLDYVNNYKICFSPFKFIKYYFFPNDNEVAERYLMLKRVCNLLQKVFVYSFFATIILLVILGFLS